MQTFLPGFVHDWSCHAADAFRTLATGLLPVKDKKRRDGITDGYPGAGTTVDSDWMRG